MGQLLVKPSDAAPTGIPIPDTTPMTNKLYE